MARLNESRIGALLTEPFGGAFSRSAMTTAHAEHGTSVLVGLDADVEITTAQGRVRGRAVVVTSDVPHAARCPGPTLSYVFDPELCAEVAGHARARGPASVIDGAIGRRIVAAVHAHRATLARAGTLAGVATDIRQLLGTGARHRLDRRVAIVLEGLRDPEVDRAPLIAASGLSPAHLQALFVRDVGVPIRTYALWRRLLHGLARVGPLDLTTAAHAAGFADLAHFSRTCRRMLGYAPSALRANLVDG